MFRSRHLVFILEVAILFMGGMRCSSIPPKSHRYPSSSAQEEIAKSNDTLMFHYDRQRQGWKSNEKILTPDLVNKNFGKAWSSPVLDSVMADKNGTLVTENGKPKMFAPHLFASPLYVENLTISNPNQTLSKDSFNGKTFNVVFAATTNGVVYAINTKNANDVSPGTILWQTKVDKKKMKGQNGQRGQLGTPVSIPNLDGDLPLGILSTPIIDRSIDPPTMYVTSVDQAEGWLVYALNITNGETIWKTNINNVILAQKQQKTSSSIFQGQMEMSQRGALNLSIEGTKLFIPFGAYNDGGVGYMVVVDTTTKQVVSAFAADDGNPLDSRGKPFASGGMWAAGGPAISTDGKLYATTGNSGEESGPTKGTWGQSLLEWEVGQDTLDLKRSYTPFNYCQMDVGDIDLAGSSPVIIDLDETSTKTPHLITFGGKQGNVYLVDRDSLNASADRRPNCMPLGFNEKTFLTGDTELSHPDPVDSKETSLFDPNGKQYIGRLVDKTRKSNGQLKDETREPEGRPGPLNVFGPYQENFNNGNFAKMRTAPAYFKDEDGQNYLYVSGTTRATPGITTEKVPAPISPGLVKLKIVTNPKEKAFLQVDNGPDGKFKDTTVSMISAGSPVITSNESKDAIVWVMDAHIPRVHTLVVSPKGPPVPTPILYAYDAKTLQVLWSSEGAPEDKLHVGGKYSIPAIGGGMVFVGTDSIQAFGLKK